MKSVPNILSEEKMHRLERYNSVQYTQLIIE